MTGDRLDTDKCIYLITTSGDSKEFRDCSLKTGSEIPPSSRSGGNPIEKRFVITEHYASHHHFDFRLEMESVLKSWAIPKQPPSEPGEKRLAILVEDHPLDYIDFEGDIPSGEYGAGRVSIWDKGRYTLLEKDENRISFSLEGMKLKGTFTLSRLKRGKKGNEWLLLKQK